MSKDLRLFDCIILFDTDVSKLASDPYALKRINDELCNYVEQGGTLIATHDIIYRRTRNLKLQQMFGCCIDSFKKIKSVSYHKSDYCLKHHYFTDLEDHFEMIDEEICWGELACDVVTLFESDNAIPLVFMREYGLGRCFYLNSGDFTKNYPSASIMTCDVHLIKILKFIITHKEFEL